jgi:hypothetical protein
MTTAQRQPTSADSAGGERPEIAILKPQSLSEFERYQMFSLHACYFRNDRFDRFCADLDAKHCVIVAWNGDREIKAFSTMHTIDVSLGETPYLFAFSGDTIVDRAAWHRNMLAPAIALFFSRLIEERPSVRRYWFLISKGYRTYRSLPIFFNRFYPHYAHPTPQHEQRLLSHIAKLKFGKNYDALRGIVSYEEPRDFLSEEMQKIPEGKENDPHVRFFLERNPGFRRGDELACLAEISHDNLNSKAHRLIVTGRRTVNWKL